MIYPPLVVVLVVVAFVGIIAEDSRVPFFVRANTGRSDVMTDAVAMQKYTLILPVVIEDFPDAHNVFLQVTNQRFCVSPHGCDTKEDAEWLRDQLCVALAKIAEDSKPMGGGPQ